MPANRVTAIAAIWRSWSWSIVMSALRSISASSSLLSPSPEPPLPCWPGTPAGLVHVAGFALAAVRRRRPPACSSEK